LQSGGVALKVRPMKMFRAPVLALSLVLAGCGLSGQEKADLVSVQGSGVPSAIYDKMLHGDELSVYDVCALERAHVDEGAILRYLREHGTVYVLSSRDVAHLEAAGTSQSVIDYMQRTAIDNAVSYPTTTIVTYAPYGPIGYSQLSASSYWGPRYYGAYDPFYGPPY
jgi:hypothetical protein